MNPGNPVICSTNSDCGANQLCVGSGSWAKCVDKAGACTYSSECGGGKPARERRVPPSTVAKVSSAAIAELLHVLDSDVLSRSQETHHRSSARKPDGTKGRTFPVADGDAVGKATRQGSMRHPESDRSLARWSALILSPLRVSRESCSLTC